MKTKKSVDSPRKPKRMTQSDLMKTVMSILAKCMETIGWAIVVPKTTKVRYLVVGEPEMAGKLIQMLDVRPSVVRNKSANGKKLTIADHYACPFCKSTNTVNNYGAAGDQSYRVRCTDCDALGPSHGTVEGAQSAWNGQAVTEGKVQ